jgi:hypothetical protein
VTTVRTQAGGWIGANQLAYAPDGTPGIVFTECDGESVFVRYATLVDSSWVIETVSEDPSTPTDLTNMLLVIPDLAYDSTGLPAVCYNHVAGAASSLRFAIRGL